MGYIPKKQAFSARINAVTLGTGARAVTIGGGNALPFYSFDAPVEHRPIVAVEVSDRGLEGVLSPGVRAYYAGCADVVEMARRAAEMPGASAVCLNLDAADPNAENAPILECAALAKAVAEAIDAPLIVRGSKNADKDAELLPAVAEALQGRNALILSAVEDNYKAVGAAAALAYNHKVGAESAVDVNLAKQLNVLLSQLGVGAENTCMQLGSAAAGYGFEYLASTMDRVRAAALMQNDAQLQMPIVTPVSEETWMVKETLVDEAEAPEWGPLEERGIEMEICTASACLISGSDLVIMRHPAAVAAIAAFIDSLV